MLEAWVALDDPTAAGRTAERGQSWDDVFGYPQNVLFAGPAHLSIFRYCEVIGVDLRLFIHLSWPYWWARFRALLMCFSSVNGTASCHTAGKNQGWEECIWVSTSFQHVLFARPVLLSILGTATVIVEFFISRVWPLMLGKTFPICFGIRRVVLQVLSPAGS